LPVQAPGGIWKSQSTSNNYDPVTGNYLGSIHTNVGEPNPVYGEYVTITAPYSFLLTAITVVSQALQAWKLAGSNDGGATYTLLQTVTGANLTTDTSYATYPIIGNTTQYSTYIFIVTNVPGGGSATLTSLNLFTIPTPCFLEGTCILSLVDDKETYLPIEQLHPGMLVKTSRNGYKKVVHLGTSTIRNPGTQDRIQQRLYKLSPALYPELTSDLYITGGHSILVSKITEAQRTLLTKYKGRVFVTEGKYRLVAVADERAEPWASKGIYTVWHISLEHDNLSMNYGVYANGGLLVETCSISYLRNRSYMMIH
jgi:hypothetical protein